MQTFYAHGKLLLTAEYTVLQGALALAFPTKFGQKLTATQAKTATISWYSYTIDNSLWFSASFDEQLNTIYSSNKATSTFLSNLLKRAAELSKKKLTGLTINTHLEFPQNWGLGSSSTLISLIAQLYEVNAMDLFFASAKGSGYDVACAEVSNPIEYQLLRAEHTHPQAQWKKVVLPEALEQACFVHLNQKQKSLPEVKRYLQQPKKPKLIEHINALSKQFLQASSVSDLQAVIDEHERVTAKAIGLDPIKPRLFKEYNGAIKSLGAWGGDFIMALGEDSKHYFTQKGYKTVLSLSEILLKSN